jgi:hypothetical protein
MQDLHDGLWLKELGFPPSGIQTWLGNLPSMGILIEKIIYKRIFSQVGLPESKWCERGSDLEIEPGSQVSFPITAADTT